MVNAILTMVGSVVLITAFMYVVKTLCNWRMGNTYGLQNVIDKNNTAYGLFRSSLFVAVAIAMLGTVNGEFITQAFHGVLGLIFIFIAAEISDRVILPNYDDRKAIIVDGNMAVSTMVSGFLLATGIVAFSSFSGEGPWWTSIVFFGIGQVILLIMARVYEWMHPELLDNIKNGETASGILLGGMFVAFAMILNGALAGNFVSMQEDMIAIAVSFGIGLGVMLVFVNQIVDRLFVTGYSMKELIETNNSTGIGIMTAIKIMLAMAIGYVVI